jgi:hypothetical protein
MFEYGAEIEPCFCTNPKGAAAYNNNANQRGTNRTTVAGALPA